MVVGAVIAPAGAVIAVDGVPEMLVMACTNQGEPGTGAHRDCEDRQREEMGKALTFMVPGAVVAASGVVAWPWRETFSRRGKQ